MYSTLGDLAFTETWKESVLGSDVESDTQMYLEIYSLGEEEYSLYLKEFGISYEKAKDGAILLNQFMNYDFEEHKYEVLDIYDYNPGDNVMLKVESLFNSVEERKKTEAEDETDDVKTQDITLSIVAVTDKRAMVMRNHLMSGGIWIISDAWMDSHPEIIHPSAMAYFDAKDPDALQNLLIKKYYVSVNDCYNIAEQERVSRVFYTMVSIFLYGFISVISLIGVTNIFNTITTSMELRSKEFAMLRSVGMTESEFRRMICLESIFYGSRALIVGLT